MPFILQIIFYRIEAGGIVASVIRAPFIAHTFAWIHTVLFIVTEIMHASRLWVHTLHSLDSNPDRRHQKQKTQVVWGCLPYTRDNTVRHAYKQCF